MANLLINSALFYINQILDTYRPLGLICDGRKEEFHEY
jgi:hypothetical protein